VFHCHSDYSIDGAFDRLKMMLTMPSTDGDHHSKISTEEYEHYSSSGRFMIIHAWRNICPTSVIKNNPLACCCADSCRDEDLVAYQLQYSDHVEGVMGLRHSDDHRWVYFPDMHIDELLLFKQFDSESTCVKADRQRIITAAAAHDGFSSSNNSSDSALIQANNHRDDNSSSNVGAMPPFVSCWAPHTSFVAEGDEDVGIMRSTTSSSEASMHPGRETIEAAVLLLF
jgi:hypothetical protein